MKRDVFPLLRGHAAKKIKKKTKIDDFQNNTMWFFYQNDEHQNNFCDSLTRNGDNGRPATDTARLACLVYDYINMVCLPGTPS